MPTANTTLTHRLSVSDLAPLRRMLGSHSMVVRVRDDGTMMPFEILPELFLGRTIRQLLDADVRHQFERACEQVIESEVPASFVPTGFDKHDEVVINPVFDSAGSCRFLVCWARRDAGEMLIAADATNATWADLTPRDIEIRFRTRRPGQIEAAPWWNLGCTGIALWEHHHRVSSVGLARTTMADVITEGVAMLAEHPDVTLRVDVPSPDMFDGLIQTFHGVLRAAGVDAERIEVGVPVEIAVDADLLPLLSHLRALGLQIDIVGLDALTETLHRVSDTSRHRAKAPQPTTVNEHRPDGQWTADVSEALRAAAA